MKFEIKIIAEQIRSLSKSIKEIEEKIKGIGRGLKGQKNLTSITGIGELNSDKKLLPPLYNTKKPHASLNFDTTLSYAINSFNLSSNKIYIC
jgi:hypothetical protein